MGETRFWTGGLIDSRILRSKDDEVDYRYMPDPDLGPVLIGQVSVEWIQNDVANKSTTTQALVDHLRQTLPLLPDQLAARLVDKQDFGLKEKDARILATMDDGGIMLDYYMDVVKQLKSLFPASELDSQKIATTVANWYVTLFSEHILLLSVSVQDHSRTWKTDWRYFTLLERKSSLGRKSSFITAFTPARKDNSRHCQIDPC